jgi:hypothetical protein
MCQETGAKATGHVAVPELPRALVAGIGATRHATVPELSYARRWEPRPWGMWRSQSGHGPWWWELEPQGMRRSWSCPVLVDGSRRTRRQVRPSCLSSLT